MTMYVQLRALSFTIILPTHYSAFAAIRKNVQLHYTTQENHFVIS